MGTESTAPGRAYGIVTGVLALVAAIAVFLASGLSWVNGVPSQVHVDNRTTFDDDALNRLQSGHVAGQYDIHDDIIDKIGLPPHSVIGENTST